MRRVVLMAVGLGRPVVRVILHGGCDRPPRCRWVNAGVPGARMVPGRRNVGSRWVSPSSEACPSVVRYLERCPGGTLNFGPTRPAHLSRGMGDQLSAETEMKCPPRGILACPLSGRMTAVVATAGPSSRDRPGQRPMSLVIRSTIADPGAASRSSCAVASPPGNHPPSTPRRVRAPIITARRAGS
jgi:hypothetical protein